jgi:hypothetical protein
MGALAAAYCLEREGTQGHSFTRNEFLDRFHNTFGSVPDLERLRDAG